MKHHKAIRVNDEYQCARCGKSWSIDEDEPECVESIPLTYREKLENSKKKLKEIREKYKI